jgi:hypothetical protein
VERAAGADRVAAASDVAGGTVVESAVDEAAEVMATRGGSNLGLIPCKT